LRARGAKNTEGTDIAAEEVISGTFRNISGTIASLDTASSSLFVKDLTSKKLVTIHITPEAQMRRLPDMMARILAARLTGARLVQEAHGAERSAAPGGAGSGQRGVKAGAIRSSFSPAHRHSTADLKKAMP